MDQESAAVLGQIIGKAVAETNADVMREFRGMLESHMTGIVLELETSELRDRLRERAKTIRGKRAQLAETPLPPPETAGYDYGGVVARSSVERLHDMEQERRTQTLEAFSTEADRLEFIANHLGGPKVRLSMHELEGLLFPASASRTGCSF